MSKALSMLQGQTPLAIVSRALEFIRLLYLYDDNIQANNLILVVSTTRENNLSPFVTTGERQLVDEKLATCQEVSCIV